MQIARLGLSYRISSRCRSDVVPRAAVTVLLSLLMDGVGGAEPRVLKRSPAAACLEHDGSSVLVS